MNIRHLSSNEIKTKLQCHLSKLYLYHDMAEYQKLIISVVGQTNLFQNEDQLVGGRHTHVTVTSIHFSCCAVHGVNLSSKIARIDFISVSSYLILDQQLGFSILVWDAHLSSIFARISFHVFMRVIGCAGTHKSESAKLTTKRMGSPKSEGSRISTSIFIFSSQNFKISAAIKRNNGRSADLGRIIQKLFKKKNGRTSYQFSSYPLRLHYCRSSTTSPSSFLKFWRAASRNEMGQQLNDAPS